jgi:hypothetical protein
LSGKFSHHCFVQTSMCKAAMKNDENFPGLERIMAGRSDRDAFGYSLEHLVKGVGGKLMWARVVGKTGSLLDDWHSVSDEAWFL